MVMVACRCTTAEASCTHIQQCKPMTGFRAGSRPTSLCGDLGCLHAHATAEAGAGCHCGSLALVGRGGRGSGKEPRQQASATTITCGAKTSAVNSAGGLWWLYFFFFPISALTLSTFYSIVFLITAFCTMLVSAFPTV